MAASGTIVSWIGGGLAGVLLTWGFETARHSWQGRRGHMYGIWHQTIPAFEDQVLKKDEVKCRHIRDSISARIRRMDPAGESHRSWRFQGKIRGNLLYGIFISESASDLSYGTIQLHKHDTHGDVWRGTYTRLRLRAQDETWTEDLPHIPLEWQRERD